jgi:L-ascorbate metabolism protein UlaG (beta-lactamase superfamily)
MDDVKNKELLIVYFLHQTHIWDKKEAHMKITYFGHACFGIEVSGIHLLFDPFISGNPLASQIEKNTIPADYILLSHGHGDHIGDAVDIALRTGAKIISSYEITDWMKRQGVSKHHPMNIGGKWAFDFGTVKMVAAVHSSSLPDGSYGGCAAGFLIETAEGSFYYSGDTALTQDMKLIGELWRPDFAFLCLGDNFTMGVEDARIAAEWVGCQRIIGMHFDTFGYIVINHSEATKAFEQQGKSLKLPAIGEIFEM